MRLSPHEQQILDEIQRGVQAEDPTFFAEYGRLPGPPPPVRVGSVMLLFGLAAFSFGAVMAQAFPGWGSA